MKTIYLIKKQNSDHFKIGFAQNTKKRLKELQTGSSEGLELIASFHTNNYAQIEAMLHRNFSYCRLSGEWFEFKNNEQATFESCCLLYEKNLSLVADFKSYKR